MSIFTRIGSRNEHRSATLLRGEGSANGVVTGASEGRDHGF